MTSDALFLIYIKECLRNKQRRVSVAQETEIVCQCVIIDFMPVTFYESRNQQKQCTLRLVEVCDHALHYLYSYPGAIIICVLVWSASRLWRFI